MASYSAMVSFVSACCAEPRAVCYSDLGGIEAVLDDIRELVEYPLQHPEVKIIQQGGLMSFEKMPWMYHPGMQHDEHCDQLHATVDISSVCRSGELIGCGGLQVYAWLGVDPPRGVLLHGPPGCGKTALAHAIANECNVPFLRISAPEIVAGVSGSIMSLLTHLSQDNLGLQVIHMCWPWQSGWQ